MINQLLIDFGKCRGIQRWTERSRLTSLYSWAVPNDEALAVIAKHSPIIEIGAGTGYWAALLTARGADVLCFDEHPPAKGRTANVYRHEVTYHKVRKGGPAEAGNYPRRALFLCWPPYDSPMARMCLENYIGNTLIFVGEGRGGCTADDAFFDELDSRWVMTEEVFIPQWDGIHDVLEVYRRKATP